jgi:thiopeptide-type bacteriocin biosynthesis protein
MPDRDGRQWLSVYLFIAPPVYAADCDRIVRAVVSPFVTRCRERDWIDKYFFIRYTENGPHVRLRLHGAPDVLERDVTPALLAHVNAERPSDLAIREIRWTPYEREYERYGGVDGIGVAEEQFEISSDAVLALLDRCPVGDRRAKLGQALLAMVAAVHAFHDDRTQASRFARQYGANYLRAVAREEAQHSRLVDAFSTSFTRQADSLIPFVEQAWEQLEEHEPLPDPLEQYHDAMRGVAGRLHALCREQRITREGRVIDDWNECVGRIVPAYVHMFNNRMGVPIPEESYLAYMLDRALQVPEHHEAPAAVGGVSS